MQKIIRIVFLIFVFSAAAVSQTASGECFAFERLAPAEREKAERLLLQALDSEALYTFVGDIKPMSSGFKSFQFPARAPRDAKQNAERAATLAEIEETRRILQEFRCGDLFFADVQHFARAFDGRRALEAVVFNTANLKKTIAARADFFSRWGITESSHPLQILYAVENDSGGARFGGYGYLFGYPEHAVGFFVAAAAEEEFSGKFVERDFYSIPTFANAANRFVYAVPKGYKETETDLALKQKAEKILAEYRQRRAAFIGEGKKGAAALMREWLCGGAQKMCRPVCRRALKGGAFSLN